MERRSSPRSRKEPPPGGLGPQDDDSGQASMEAGSMSKNLEVFIGVNCWNEAFSQPSGCMPSGATSELLTNGTGRRRCFDPAGNTLRVGDSLATWIGY